MEGGNFSNISLEGMLDTSTNDMFTPVQANTLQHNWQKYQGKYIANSLRFEKNGWGAGWCVYNFDYDFNLKQFDDIFVGIKRFNNFVKWLSVYEDKTSYNSKHDYVVIDSDVILNGDVTINGDMITGTVDSVPFSLTWDRINRVAINNTPVFKLIQESNSDYSTTLKVMDLDKSYDLTFDFLLPDSLYGDNILSRSYTGFDGLHKWGGYSYNENNNTVITPEGYVITPNIINNEIRFSYNIDNKAYDIVLAYSFEQRVVCEASSEVIPVDPNTPRYDDKGKELPLPEAQVVVIPQVVKNIPTGLKLSLSQSPDYTIIGELADSLEKATVSITDNYNQAKNNPDNFDSIYYADITVLINNREVKFRYSAINGTTLLNGPITIINDGTGNVTITSATKAFANIICSNYRAKFAKIPTAYYNIVSISDNIVIVKYSDRQVSFDYINKTSEDDIITYDLLGGYNVNIKKEVVSVFTVAFKGILNDGIYENDNSFYIIYQGKNYHFTFNELKNMRQFINVLSTDIRTPNKTISIDRIPADEQFQLIKQQWCSTCEVENFWWVDDIHILELSNTSFTLKRKTNELDDWNGDRFEPIWTIPRSDVIDTSHSRYFVTNVSYNDRDAIFVYLKCEQNNISVFLYDIRHKFKLIKKVSISLRTRNIGQQLNDIVFNNNVVYFNSYNVLSINKILLDAKWTGSIVNNDIIIGCHFNNNYDQWSFVINLNLLSITRVIQGYGFVGVNGELTGGMLPDEYCDLSKGFNGTVLPLSVLGDGVKNLHDLDKAAELTSYSQVNDVKRMVVGNAEQQWYIQSRLYGIVSHIQYVNGTFIKKIIPITNNYSAVYKSPSFSSSVIADALVAAHPLATMFKFESGVAKALWNVIMAACLEPMLWSFSPRYSFICYLQQTFGQYAYVHYNSSKSLPEEEQARDLSDETVKKMKTVNEKGKLELNSDHRQVDPILDGYLTFDKQKVTQKADTKLKYNEVGIIGILLGALIKTLITDVVDPAINKEHKKTTISDFTRDFVDNAAENADNALVATMITQSNTDTGLTSVVTGIKSIDMFYSTSEQQSVFAGPGFVEHQFVAQCSAQSVTSTHCEGKSYQMFFLIRMLTEYQCAKTIELQEKLYDFLNKQAETMQHQVVGNFSVATVASLALRAAAYAVNIAITITKKAYEMLQLLMNALEGEGVTVTQDGMISKHDLSVEGKHKYGEKNEVFMWPCWGVTSGQLKYTDEYVESGIKNTPWKLSLNSIKQFNNPFWDFIHHCCQLLYPKMSAFNFSIGDVSSDWQGGTDNNPLSWARRHSGDVDFYQAACFGRSVERTLPDDMVKVEGVSSFLNKQAFKNQNIGVSEPVFVPSVIHDYIIDKNWELSQCGTYGMTQWVTVRDTKIINGSFSNIIVRDNFCGVACPYTAIEVKRGVSKEYMRPWAITPNTLAFNCTGYNTILDNKLYHSFDGISYRLIDLVGAPKLNGNRQSFFYNFQVNNRFKRSNILPPMELQGNFNSDPVTALATIDKTFILMTITAKEKGLEVGTIGEDKDATRWSIPIFTEAISTLPAAVKTLYATPLAVVDGVTGLVTKQIFGAQSAYKAPLSIDFTIGKNAYRVTEEYICTIEVRDIGEVVTDIIPILGLKFIGATTTAAYFYSKSTRCYYVFSGSALTKMNMMERFRDIQKGYWDFVNQEIIMPCLMTYKRLNAEVEDKDTETDNIIVPVLSGSNVSGELPPPLTTIFNDKSWYKVYSLPSGLAYQGPNRVIINRSVFVEYMLDSIKENLGKWKKLPREKYSFKREYKEIFKSVNTEVHGVDGWTHNPFVFVTSAIGAAENVDCLFEWVITFCWPIEMDLLYGVDNYACVNIAAETMSQGGKIITRPTHVFLTKELFTRTGNYGYYTFRYQSKNGAGNRERLHIWCDQYIAISSIGVEYKVISQKRSEILTQQVDIQKLEEL